MALLLIFYSNLFSGLFLLWYYQLGSTLFVNNLLLGYLHISLFFTAMTFTYCFVYLGLIDDSPSLFTIMSIFNAGKKGISRNEIDDLINDDIFIKPRFEYLIKEKMVYKFADKYLLASKGCKLLNTYIVIQKLMKLPLKSG